MRVTPVATELWAQFWAEHRRASALLAMLPCWEMFEMDEAELYDALCNGEMIAAEMSKSNERGLAILDEIDKQKTATAGGDPAERAAEGAKQTPSSYPNKCANQ
jgi:hypothetical protein